VDSATLTKPATTNHADTLMNKQHSANMVKQRYFLQSAKEEKGCDTVMQAGPYKAQSHCVQVQNWLTLYINI